MLYWTIDAGGCFARCMLGCLRRRTPFHYAACANGETFVKSVNQYSTRSSFHEEDDKAGRPTTPWVRQVISGVDLMRHPKYNKGLAFSDMERDRLYLRGLLPPAVLSQEVQLERTLLNIRSKDSDLEKSTYLQGLQERNERLFHRVLLENLEELLPVVYNPTVRLACQKYGLMFKSLPRGLFITLEDRGRVFRILKNWPERNVKLLVVSDGERVGDLGDLGVQAVGVPISKISLYTACGGIPPSITMPVMIDVGTDNEELLRSPFYVGVRHRRVRGDPYYELMDEFLTAVKRRFGNTVLVQFEEMAYDNASKLLNMYRTEFPCFNDDMAGVAAAVLAGIMAALPRTGGRLSDHRIIFVGEGAVVACIAELFATAVATQTSQTVLDARRRLWLVDSQGLVTRERGDSSTLESYKLPYCHSGPDCRDLTSAVKLLKPTVLVGLSTHGTPPFPFTPEVLQTMAETCKHPLIFPLSAGMPECTAAEGYSFTEGRALVATEQKVEAATLPNGRTCTPSQCTSTYIFPGVALGALISRCTKLRDEQFIAAADAVSRMVTEEELSRGSIYPALSKIRDVSASVAKAVAQKAYEGGFATALPKPHNLYEAARQNMYHPQYRRYR
ncbi:hypothetical protein Vafri_12415 [Volvox africanus]|uniref:Malic enzyme n=2 Tax=Volvox africanus TaxID=51714 RepID=A0A8J4F2F2_9CHLO|nr:hypothetical protein Vafri_12415 [Volvox africanus]